MKKRKIVLKSRSVLEVDEELEKTIESVGLNHCLTVLEHDLKKSLNAGMAEVGWVTETEANLLDPASDITKSKELRSGIKDKEERVMTEFKTLKDIVEQLKDCGYECEAGPLVNNVAFQKLAAMAEVDVESGEESYYSNQADNKEEE